MIQKILSIENEKKKKRYKSIYHVNKKNEFNEDDDWFDRLIEHAVRKEKLNFFFEIDIIRHTEVKNLDHQGQRTTWNCSFLPILFSEKACLS